MTARRLTQDTWGLRGRGPLARGTAHSPRPQPPAGRGSCSGKARLTPQPGTKGGGAHRCPWVSRHWRSALPTRPLQDPRLPGPTPHPCAPRRARKRADSWGQQRHGRAEEEEPSSRAAKPPWPASLSCRSAQQSRAEQGAALRHGRKAGERERRGRPCAFPACDPRPGDAARGRGAGGCSRAAVPGGSDGVGAGAAPEDFFLRVRADRPGAGPQSGRRRERRSRWAAAERAMARAAQVSAARRLEGPRATPAPARPLLPLYRASARRRVLPASDAGRPARPPPGASSGLGGSEARPSAAALSPRGPL